MAIKRGKVYIVGAGPGDPELMTVKGVKALKKADVILYDFLADRKLLRYAKKTAEKICVGKADGVHLLEQRAINKLLYEKSEDGKIVVRLKGGDPFVFSRGIEEAVYLKNKEIDFEVIPGLTSAFTAPQSFGIPLTRKGRYSSIAVLTGRKSDGSALDAPDCDTLIYLMGVSAVRDVVKAVLKSGKKNSTPCAFIERGTTDAERIVLGTLGTIVEKARSYGVKPPAVLIVGDIVKLGRQIYGYKYK